MPTKNIAIIGAGVAGLSAGIYAQANGYRTEIFEMHTQPGGLCTAWERKGYTIDGCIHWFVGSNPESSMYRLWEEVGVVRRLAFINADTFARFEDADGRSLVFYTDVDRLAQHLLDWAPQDAAAIGDFIAGIRLCLRFDPPTAADPLGRRIRKNLKIGWLMATRGRAMQRWMKTTAADFAARFKDPLLSRAMVDLWYPDFSVFFALFTFAYLHRQDAGYPIGGSRPITQALVDRYRALGGTLHTGQRVDKILVADDRAVGLRLADGAEHRADRVVSAADGHATIFDMLDGAYVDDAIRTRYETWPLFPGLLYIALGVDRPFDDVPETVAGVSLALPEPTRIADTVRDRLPVHIYNQDPTLAPKGKRVVIVMLESDYDYWRGLAADRATYRAAKDEAAQTVIRLLDHRWPGLANQVEMVDVATPLTFERTTGNRQGSFEGWMLTPDNAHSIMKPIPQTLPGLDAFAMCGQWVEPGGGLPSGVMSARRLLQAWCKEDGQRFKAP